MTPNASGPEWRLAVYGSLAPGEKNHHHLASADGRWIAGTVTGELRQAGWGAALGFPGIVLTPHAGLVTVQVFESAELPDHWDRLDAFEGPEYRRSVTAVDCAGTLMEASIYELADQSTETGLERPK